MKKAELLAPAGSFEKLKIAFLYGADAVYAGGKDYSKSQYDRVTQSVRPSGSAFKPFIYTAAIEKGFSPNDMIDDLPFKAGNWTPKNYGNKYRGPIPLYTAFMVSSLISF